MTPRISQISSLLVLAGLFVVTIAFADAGDASHLSGLYRVLGKTEIGSQTHLRLQLQLANHGSRDLQIERITFWHSPHRPGGRPLACSLLVHPGSSANTTQEVVMPSAEYRLWAQGARLKLLVAVDEPGGRKATELVRLDPISSREKN